MNLTRKLKTSVALAIAGVITLPSCASPSQASAKAENPETWKIASIQQGQASWYSVNTNGGTRTASGQRLANTAATAAHKTLPLGSKVRVVNLSNGKSEIVTITDRGPFVRNRLIDVTVGVAERLGFVANGIASVKLEVLGTP